MGLNTQAPVEATLDGDGTTLLRFDGRWPKGVKATLDGERVWVSYGKTGSISVWMFLRRGSPHRLVISR
jgi:hypothetical protein